MRSSALIPALLGVLFGSALQVGQTQLWPFGLYIAFLPLALIFVAVVAINKVSVRIRFFTLVLALAALTFGATGLRAGAFMAQSLAPALEGCDLAVSGVVTSMPQRNETGLRFRFDVETATLDGQIVRLPKRLELAWYSGVFARGDGPGELLGELQRVPAPLQGRGALAIHRAPEGATRCHQSAWV